MNQDIIYGKWKQLKGSLEARWGTLTDDDLDRLEGNQQVLAGRIQERYGVARDEAEKQVREFETSLH